MTGFVSYRLPIKDQRKAGFTLVELLVVIGVMSLLLAIMIPAMGRVRAHARNVININNQRQIVQGVTAFATDHRDRYPESVATITSPAGWHWQEPTMMISCKPRSLQIKRSMSSYLGGYIADVNVMFCPNAPEKYQHFEASWADGDAWDNPKTWFSADPVYGSYCFYWNYIGFLPNRDEPFRGPRMLGDSDASTLLVSDYFGYGHWRNRNVGRGRDWRAYGSCEKFRGARVTPGTDVSSAFWSRSDPCDLHLLNDLDITLTAGYADGHVEHFSAAKVVPMMVATQPDGSEPYPTWLSTNPGIFFLPQDALP